MRTSARTQLSVIPIAALCLLIISLPPSARAEMVGVTAQYDFDGGLSTRHPQTMADAVAIGAPGIRFGTCAEFGIPGPGGAIDEQVMCVPALRPGQAIRIQTNAGPDGPGGKLISTYTILFDILFPKVDGWASFFRNGRAPDDADGDFFKNPTGAIGVGSIEYSLNAITEPNRWYRVIVIIDAAKTGRCRRYVDGVLVNDAGTITLDDPRFGLSAGKDGPGIDLFRDNNGETSECYVNSVQFRNYAMPEEEARLYGMAAAGGLMVPGPVPTPTPTPVPPPDRVIDAGPWVLFERSGEARFFWRTREPAPCILEYGYESPDEVRRESPAEEPTEDRPLRHEHALTVSGLRPDAELQYRIGAPGPDGALAFGPTYTLDTTFDDAGGPLSDLEHPWADDPLTPRYEAAVEELRGLGLGGKGYCLIWGAADGRLAFEIVRRTSLSVLALEPDAERAARARALMDRLGVPRRRLTIEAVDPDHISLPPYFADLLLCDELPRAPDGMPLGSADPLLKAVRPFGGKAVSGPGDTVRSAREDDHFGRWLQTSSVASTGSGSHLSWGATHPYPWLDTWSPDLEHTGQWTHFYAEPGNTACSGEQRVGAGSGDLDLLWFGRPGPRLIINRHSRPMSSLFYEARAFSPGDDRVICFNAYNGTRYWDLAVPGSRRLGAFKTSGQMALVEQPPGRKQNLYIASHDACVEIDIATGEPRNVLKTPPTDSDEAVEWGYLACLPEVIIGSSQPAGAGFHEYTDLGNCDVLEGDDRALIVSDALFARARRHELTPAPGRLLWSRSEGAILNNTIAVGDNTIWFLENPEMPEPDGVWEGPGRRTVAHYLQGAPRLVALNIATGEEFWSRPIELPYSQIAYLSAARGVLLFVGSYNRDNHAWYGLYAFSSKNGEPLWDNAYDSGSGVGGSHGEQWQRPVVIDRTVYMLNGPAHDLLTGERRPFSIARGDHGCGTISGSMTHLYGRGSNPRTYPVATEGQTSGERLTATTRPGCFINILPVGGLVLIPESSSGCTCAYPLQTSLAFYPADVR